MTPSAIPHATPSSDRSSDSYETERNGTDGESGCERDTSYVPNADASRRPNLLAYPTNCRYCGELIYLAICRDGKWRTFETRTVPAAPFGVWAWRKTWGMEEQDRIAGKTLHYCAQYDKPDVAPWDRGYRS